MTIKKLIGILVGTSVEEDCSRVQVSDGRTSSLLTDDGSEDEQLERFILTESSCSLISFEMMYVM